MSYSVVQKLNNSSNRDYDIRNTVNTKPYWLKVKTRDVMQKLRQGNPNAAGKIDPNALKEDPVEQVDGFFKGREDLVELMLRQTRENEEDHRYFELLL
jgi:hypothetical protein